MSLEKAENCDNCELFYTTVEEFDNYCNFLFGVLLKVRKNNRDFFSIRMIQ